MTDIKEKVISLFDNFLERIENNYDLSEEQKKVIREQIKKDVIEVI